MGEDRKGGEDSEGAQPKGVSEGRVCEGTDLGGRCPLLLRCCSS